MKHLPGVLAIIASEAGRETALAIAAKHGGEELRIPLDPPEDHWLCAYIGWEATQKVAVKIIRQQGAVTSIPFVPINLPDDIRFNTSTLNLISSVIGATSTIYLAENFQGVRLNVPKDPLSNLRLVEAIGIEAAKKLCDVFYATVLYIPKKECILFRIDQLRKAGVTPLKISKRVGIAERQIFRALRELKDNPLT